MKTYTVYFPYTVKAKTESELIRLIGDVPLGSIGSTSEESIKQQTRNRVVVKANGKEHNKLTSEATKAYRRRFNNRDA